MSAKRGSSGGAPAHISLVAIPDAVVSTIGGLYDALNALSLAGPAGTPGPIRIEIVGERRGPLELASGISIEVEKAISEIASTDVLIVPSVLLRSGSWTSGRYPAVVEWIAHAHRRGALVCSACSGVFLLAETGLFDGMAATVHYMYAPQFTRSFPSTRVHPEKALVVSGEREELITSGASTSWHDLALYLISRLAGTAAAQDVAKLLALQWHAHGLSPYMMFDRRLEHGDAEVRQIQEWLAKNFASGAPVETAAQRFGIAERTLTRRFRAATGMAPMTYVQRLRVEEAKRRLERTGETVDEISWRVGYEDAAHFRRLFKSVSGTSPATYRKLFKVPNCYSPPTSTPRKVGDE